jgi:hypothetical protein
MRRDFLVGIGLLASVGAGAGSVLAADLPVRSASPIAAPATCCAVPDWAGFYVGIHGGGGWGHESFDSSESFFFQNQEKMVDPPFLSLLHPVPVQRAVSSASSSATTGNGDRSSGAWKSTSAARISTSRPISLARSCYPRGLSTRSHATKRSTNWLPPVVGSAT